MVASTPTTAITTAAIQQPAGPASIGPMGGLLFFSIFGKDGFNLGGIQTKPMHDDALNQARKVFVDELTDHLALFHCESEVTGHGWALRRGGAATQTDTAP